MNSKQSDTESNVSGFITYSDQDIKKLYASAIKGMESINQNVLLIERNLKSIVKQSGHLEKQVTCLLQALPQPSVNLAMEQDSPCRCRGLSVTWRDLREALQSSDRNVGFRGVYSGNSQKGPWVEDTVECVGQGAMYFRPKEEIDYDKFKPELRRNSFRQNRMQGVVGTLQSVIKHDSHDSCNNFVTTNDLTYNHLNKHLCGPNYRMYRRGTHTFHPQPDNAECFADKGFFTDWGLKTYMESVWKCSNLTDYTTTLYEDTYVPPRPNQYLHKCERKARNSNFTKTFQFKMTKPIQNKKNKSK